MVRVQEKGPKVLDYMMMRHAFFLIRMRKLFEFGIVQNNGDSI